jgi:hypothetical protein
MSIQKWANFGILCACRGGFFSSFLVAGKPINFRGRYPDGNDCHGESLKNNEVPDMNDLEKDKGEG